jgi:hypothetical protein
VEPSTCQNPKAPIGLLKPAGEGHGQRGSTKSKLTIHEEKIVKAAAPASSRFKGYTSFVVQDLAIRSHVVNFRCERRQTPDGDIVTALDLVSLASTPIFGVSASPARALLLQTKMIGSARRLLPIKEWLQR